MDNKSSQIGDPVSWFDAHTLAGTRHNLGVLGGRWVVLCFINSLSDLHATRVLAELIMSLGRFFNDDHMVFFAVLGEAPPPIFTEKFVEASHRGLGFMMDYDGAISRQFEALGSPRLIVLDPMLRIEKIYPLQEGGASSSEIGTYLGSLPKIDDYAGVPLMAPALVIPHVFEPDFCDFLVGLHEKSGGTESGFMLDKDGKTQTIVNHDYKSRRDLLLEDPEIREAIRDRVARRVVPMMERFLQYRPTRMDRYLVSCYDAETGGHFTRHRDNVNLGARHRRFAASFNLNDGFEGCELVFPEFGRRLYKPPRGGAIVFSTGALHQVLPITRGKRYAFVPFFYGEDEAHLRMRNNEYLDDGEGLYTGERDKLFPEAG